MDLSSLAVAQFEPFPIQTDPYPYLIIIRFVMPMLHNYRLHSKILRPAFQRTMSDSLGSHNPLKPTHTRLDSSSHLHPHPCSYQNQTRHTANPIFRPYSCLRREPPRWFFYSTIWNTVRKIYALHVVHVPFGFPCFDSRRSPRRGRI